MKRVHDKDQVELAGALTSLRTEDPNDEQSTNTSKHDRFTGAPVEERHVTWTAWTKYLDDYCHSNNVRIGIEFTDSIQKRNEEMRKSKRAKAGKFVRFLPEELEAYRRSYVCHLGRKGRTRDVKFRRTACPFKLVAKSVFDEGKWEVEVVCSNAEHIHSETTGRTTTPASDETMTTSSPQVQPFVVEELKGCPSSRTVLTDLVSRCKRMPESEQMCNRLLQRLEQLHDSVAPLDEKDSLKVVYVDVIVRIVKLMHRKPLLMRLANSETTLFKLYELHEKLDDVARGIGLNSDDIIADGGDQLTDERRVQYDKLKQEISNASDRILINEFRGKEMLHAALMTLTSGMKWRNLPPDMLALKRETLDRVIKILPGLTTVDWFIPNDDLEYEDRIIGAGTFGEARRGSWLQFGERTDMVVKHLFKDINSYSSDMFRKQLEFWCTLDDKHILKLFGGSYVDVHKFFVCEYAEGGNLRVFFAKKNNRSQLWRMFRQAAEGLKVLHTKKHPHGALKCSNILVGADNIVKLSDFGFQSVRTLSASLSGDAEEAFANAIRWKPKELLEKEVQEELLYKADVYALGMCMIEALTQKDPFPNVDNNQVEDVIKKGTTHYRPGEISEPEWAFICRLCNPDYTNRPNLDNVLNEINTFAENEEKQHDPAER